MKKEITVDYNLFFLLNILYTLDYFEFDIEVKKSLDSLKLLIDKKLFSSFDFSKYNIIDKQIAIRFFLNE